MNNIKLIANNVLEQGKKIKDRRFITSGRPVITDSKIGLWRKISLFGVLPALILMSGYILSSVYQVLSNISEQEEYVEHSFAHPPMELGAHNKPFLREENKNNDTASDLSTEE